MDKLTKRNVFEALVNYATEGAMEFEKDGAKIEVTPEEIKAFAENEIGLLDKKAAKAKERGAKKKEERDELCDAVQSALTDEFATIADIASLVEGEDVTVSKVTYRLNKLVAAGLAEKADIKVGGEDGKKTRTVKGYRAVAGDGEIGE
ncbi:MAG: hypothetical protein LIR50_17395 [Bacillota bacterium]|nr:hypothetical protein [Bacillota bacterium]